ncbi:MAG: mechanosensitive ion channel [Steroidobacteraceae bacterium]
MKTTSFVRSARLALIAAVSLGPWPATAATATPATPSAGAADPPIVVTDSPPAELKVANRVVSVMRADVFGATPAERAEAARERLGVIIEKGGPLQVSTQAVPEGVAIQVDGRTVFRVLGEDVDSEAGQSLATASADAAANLRKALAEIREAEDARVVARAAGHAVLATLALALVVWLLHRGYRWIVHRLHGFAQRRMAKYLPPWTGEVVGEAALGGLFTLPVRIIWMLIVLLLTYQWAGFVLRRFPYTRPLGEELRDNLFDALGRVGAAVLEAVPGLLFALLIFLIARITVRAVRAFFNGVERGHIRIAAIDETTARPTGRLVTLGIWLFAMVAAYPYIPGTDSEAFKGIGVFVGLMMSIGASGVVSQVVSGLMLMYTRALRPGEFVRIGETEGIVKSVGFLATRIETVLHEEINVPNSIIAGNVTRNYSRLASEGGIWMPTKVTIGYDTPWRQVRAMLLAAAARTDGVQKDPPPRVHQTALLDFYVEYTLIVSLETPIGRMAIMDRLHGNIQDAFNEHGVQIMSPNYEADPQSPKVVPKEKWFEPPASR